MVSHRKATIVTGYAAMKAAQRAEEHRDPHATPPEKPQPAAEKIQAQPLPPGTHIGRTVMPTKYEVLCHECGYSFSQAGRSKSTICPKCKTQLDFTPYTIDTSWTKSITTAGTVTIKSDGVVRAGKIFAAEVVLEGSIEGGQVEAYRRLEIRPGARYDETCIHARDLRVAQDADAGFSQKISFRSVEISGHLQARLTVTASIKIKAGGLLSGELISEHLSVEEGGGLEAHVRVVPEESSSGSGG